MRKPPLVQRTNWAPRDIEGPPGCSSAPMLPALGALERVKAERSLEPNQAQQLKGAGERKSVGAKSSLSSPDRSEKSWVVQEH